MKKGGLSHLTQILFNYCMTESSSVHKVKSGPKHSSLACQPVAQSADVSLYQVDCREVRNLQAVAERFVERSVSSHTFDNPQ